jgi:hypothetical protein
MTISEATRALGFASENYTRRIIKSGALRADLVNGRYDVDEASVDEYRQRTQLKRSARAFERPTMGAKPSWMEAAS